MRGRDPSTPERIESDDERTGGRCQPPQKAAAPDGLRRSTFRLMLTLTRPVGVLGCSHRVNARSYATAAEGIEKAQPTRCGRSGQIEADSHGLRCARMSRYVLVRFERVTRKEGSQTLSHAAGVLHVQKMRRVR